MSVNKLVATFDRTRSVTTHYVYQYDYGAVLYINGVKNLPDSVEVQFTYNPVRGRAIVRVGTTSDGVLSVDIPNPFLENNGITINYYVFALFYVEDADAKYGKTVYTVRIPVKTRQNPHTDKPVDEGAFAQAVKNVGDLAKQAEAYKKQAEAWAHGDVADYPECDGDNAKYWSEASKAYNDSAKTYSEASEASATRSGKSAEQSSASASTAGYNADTARQAASDAADSAASAKKSKIAAADSANASAKSEANASHYADQAKANADFAKKYVDEHYADYASIKSKVNGIAAGAQVNVLEGVKVNGTALTPSAKVVNVTITTGATDGSIAVNGTDIVIKNFSNKANKATTLAGYGITDAYTRAQTDSAISSAVASVFKYRGTKKTSSELPTSGQTIGDVYFVAADSSEYAWNGDKWEELGPVIDLSHFITSISIAGLTLSSSDTSITQAQLRSALGLGAAAYLGVYKSTDSTAPSNGDAAVPTVSEMNKMIADTTYTAATTSANGLMSAADKSKLDGISSGADVSPIKTVKVNGTALTPDSDKAVNVTVPTLANNATTTTSGMALDARMGKALADQVDALAKKNNGLYFDTNSDGKWGYKTSSTGTLIPFRNPSGNAKPSDVREGKTFSSAELENATGTLKESTLEVKEDGTYTPDEGELYSKVVVSTGGKGGNLVTKTITENGTYDAKKEYYDKDKNIMADGFSSVTVNVAGSGSIKESRVITAVAQNDFKAGDDAACYIIQKVGDLSTINGGTAYKYGNYIYIVSHGAYDWYLKQYDLFGKYIKTVVEGNDVDNTGIPPTNYVFDGKYILVANGRTGWCVVDASTGTASEKHEWGDLKLNYNQHYGTGVILSNEPWYPIQSDKIIVTSSGGADAYMYLFDLAAQTCTALDLRGYMLPFPYTENSFIAIKTNGHGTGGWTLGENFSVIDVSGKILKSFPLSDDLGYYKTGGVVGTYFCLNQKLYCRGITGTDYAKTIFVWDLGSLADGTELNAGNATKIDVGIDLNAPHGGWPRTPEGDVSRNFYLSDDGTKLVSACTNGTYYIDIATNKAYVFTASSLDSTNIAMTDVLLSGGVKYDYETGDVIGSSIGYIAIDAKNSNQYPENRALGYAKAAVKSGAKGKFGIVFDSLNEMYNFDFTKSLTDTIGRQTAVLKNGATQDASGIHISAAKQYAELFKVPAIPFFFEATFGDFDAKSNGSGTQVFYARDSKNEELIPLTFKNGETSKWYSYQRGYWSSELSFDESPTAFNNKTILYEIREDGISIYVKGDNTYTKVLTWGGGISQYPGATMQIGRSDQWGAYGFVLKSLKVTHGTLGEHNLSSGHKELTLSDLTLNTTHTASVAVTTSVSESILSINTSGTATSGEYEGFSIGLTGAYRITGTLTCEVNKTAGTSSNYTRGFSIGSAKNTGNYDYQDGLSGYPAWKGFASDSQQTVKITHIDLDADTLNGAINLVFWLAGLTTDGEAFNIDFKVDFSEAKIYAM